MEMQTARASDADGLLSINGSQTAEGGSALTANIYYSRAESNVKFLLDK